MWVFGGYLKINYFLWWLFHESEPSLVSVAVNFPELGFEYLSSLYRNLFFIRIK